MTKNSYQILLNYAFWLLSRKAYTESELHQRLMKKALRAKLEAIESTIKRIMDRLRELNYVNDAKILEDHLEYRLKSRPQGKYGYLHEMHRRGISFDFARLAWEKKKIKERPLAYDLIKRREYKFRGLPAPARKNKIAGLLVRRGFSPETVWDVVGSM